MKNKFEPDELVIIEAFGAHYGICATVDKTIIVDDENWVCVSTPSGNKQFFKEPVLKSWDIVFNRQVSF